MKKSEIKIAEMQPSDVSIIKQIELECGLSVWKTEDYLTEIKRADSITKIAVSDKEIAGFILARLITTDDKKSTNCAEIYNIAVRNKWQKQGIGKKLIENLTAICRQIGIAEIFLEVRKSNENARSFYSKLGFKDVAERKKYYTLPTDDAVIMRYNLKKMKT